uniref:Uncharacterized protein n=1 Tax=Candidatus Kentrum sp. FW TaxID=2126338 RepID=A0A450SPU1_9GAMM|nr:MAG: hypothetical protein BECKFW1821B_GA0114236_102512 [Candidatus Kentron sp. FW]
MGAKTLFKKLNNQFTSLRTVLEVIMQDGLSARSAAKLLNQLLQDDNPNTPKWYINDGFNNPRHMDNEDGQKGFECLSKVFTHDAFSDDLSKVTGISLATARLLRPDFSYLLDLYGFKATEIIPFLAEQGINIGDLSEQQPENSDLRETLKNRDQELKQWKARVQELEATGNQREKQLQAEIDRLSGDLREKEKEVEALVAKRDDCKREFAYWQTKAEAANTGYLDPNNPRYAPKLAAAVRAWQAVTNPGRRSPKKALEEWLREHAMEYDLIHPDGKPIELAIDDCAKIANWQLGGGAPKTPGG